MLDEHKKKRQFLYSKIKHKLTVIRRKIIEGIREECFELESLHGKCLVTIAIAMEHVTSMIIAGDLEPFLLLKFDVLSTEVLCEVTSPQS